MALVEHVKMIIEGTKKGIETVIPFPFQVEEETWLKSPIHQKEIGVLVSITGDIKVRLILEESLQAFKQLGENMYGMPLEDQMLESFVGEMGNMIAGTIASYLFEQGFTIDITPPTVMVGETKIYGFDRAINQSIHIEGIGHLRVLLIVEQEM